MRASPGATFTWTPIEFAITGLVGTMEVAIYDGDTILSAASTAGINELGTLGTYEAERTAPTTAGRYVLVASHDGSFDPETLVTEELVVSFSSADASDPDDRDLCTLEDVLNLLPGYRSNETVEAKLQEKITAESEMIHEDTAREIVAAANQPEARDFDVTRDHLYDGEISIGDLATVDGLALELRNSNGDVVRTIDPDTDVVPLYRFGRRQPRASWEPVVALRFHRKLTPGYTLRATGTYGFPSIPPHIREACAKRVLLRYLSDGPDTQIIEAAANLNLAAMFASARDEVESIKDTVYIR